MRTIVALLISLALLTPHPAQAQSSGSEPPPGAADHAYVVREGDTLNGIAARLLHEGESRRVQRALAQHNRLADPDRIWPGQTILIPRAWLKSGSAEIEVAAVQGEVASRGGPLAAGAKLAAGDDLRTGKDGFVTLKLVDGSTLSLMPNAAARVERAQATPSGTTDTAVHLNAGRAETAVQRARQGASRFEIRTPVAIAAVRGTEFRVAVDGGTGATTSEVVEGEVGVEDTGGRATVGVAAGFGTRVRAGEAPLAPRRLLPAPTLWGGVQLIDRSPFAVSFAPLAGAQTYRVFISPSEDLRPVLAEEILAAPELRFAQLADGDYFVRVRGIDDIGLEGRDTMGRLRVRLRADPPRPSAPPERSRIYGDAVEFAWQAQPDVSGYVLEIARDAQFRTVIGRWADLREPRHAAANLAPGDYFWRVAALQQSGALSHYSAPRAVSLRPSPRGLNPARIEEETIVLSWPAAPGQGFEVQLAADAAFTSLVAEKRTAVPQADFPRGPGGNYFARVRTVEPDGTFGPYSPVLALTVPKKDPKPACLIPGPDGLCATYAPLPRAKE